MRTNFGKALMLGGIGLGALTMVSLSISVKGPGLGIDLPRAVAMDSGGGGEGGGSGGAAGGGGEGGGTGDPSGGDRGQGEGQTGGQSGAEAGAAGSAGGAGAGGAGAGQGGKGGGAGERSGGKGAADRWGETGGIGIDEAGIDVPAHDESPVPAVSTVDEPDPRPAVGVLPPSAPAHEIDDRRDPAPAAVGAEAVEPQQPPTAILRLQKAADRGDAEAQFELAVAYEKGLAVGQDTAWAARWYGRAAFRGHSEAQYKYANLKLAEPTRTSRDLARAYRWLTLAAQRGHDRADDVRTKLERDLSIDQIYRARAWADAFEPTAAVSPWDPPTVEYLQRKLTDLGYNPGPVDGDMGPLTVAALESYKKDRGLAAEQQVAEEILRIIRGEDRGGIAPAGPRARRHAPIR